jgi:spermidine synthase
MKKILNFGFLLMGFSFTVTQGLLIRELLVAFFGNELSIGLILGNWLILEAVGSGLLGKLADRWRGKASSFAALQVLFALFLPLCLYAAYTSRRIVGAIPGEGVGLIPIFTSSFLILTPLALVDGAMFAFGCRAYATLTGNEAPAIGWVYIYEALGAIAGGIVFTYLFIPFLYSLQIVLLLSALNLLSAALVLATCLLRLDLQSSRQDAGLQIFILSEAKDQQERKRLPLALNLIAVLFLLIASLGFLLSPQVETAQRWAASQQWAGHHLVYSQNSVYGNVAVVQREAQYTFYADGIPILTAPVPDVALTEEMVHLPMLFIPQPQRALVLSGGVGGVLRELAKYPLKQIDYAELDPLLIEAVLKFPTPLTLSELSDPRVRVEPVDGRLLVRRKKWGIAPQPQGENGGYDLVIVNLPYPSTLQLNRFYTAEFFQMVRGLLAKEGILVIGCPGTLTYMSDELRHLNTMAYHTLQQVFPHVRPIPGDVTLWLASPSDALSTVPVEALVERWEERGLETQLLTAPHIRLRLGQMRLDWFWTSLGEEENGGKAVVNRDLHPVGLFYGLSYWNALFSPHLAQVFAFTGRLNLWTLSLPIIGCALLFLTVVRLTAKGRGACPEPVLSRAEGPSRRTVIPVVIATTGFTGMTADLVIVFAFQTLYGYVYHWIGLLITAFMAGLSLGGLLMTRKLKSGARHLQSRKGLAPDLLKLDLAILLYWALLPIALSTLYARIPHPLAFTSIQGLLLFFNALAGFLVGSQFPLANRIWLKGREDLRGTAGVLYACDLVGAFLGSIVVSVILIPVLGILETCLLAATLKLGSLLLVAALPSPSPNPLPLPKFGRGRGSPKGRGG